jgi:RHS repeat-associated protein
LINNFLSMSLVWALLLFLSGVPIIAQAQYRWVLTQGGSPTEVAGNENATNILLRTKREAWSGDLWAYYPGGHTHAHYRLISGDVYQEWVWFPGGSQQHQKQYKNGRLDGPSYLYYTNGATKAELWYRDGQLVSILAKHPSGAIAYNGHIVDGKPFPPSARNEEGQDLRENKASTAEGPLSLQEVLDFIETPVAVDEKAMAEAARSSPPPAETSEVAPPGTLKMSYTALGGVGTLEQDGRSTRYVRDANDIVQGVVQTGTGLLTNEVRYSRKPGHGGIDAVEVVTEDGARQTRYFIDGYITGAQAGALRVSYRRVLGAPLLAETRLEWEESGVSVVRLTRLLVPGPTFHRVEWKVGERVIDAQSYTYLPNSDLLSSCQQSDGTVWRYSYDKLDHLGTASLLDGTSGKPVPGLQFAYKYDTIGNLLASAETTWRGGGNKFVANDRNVHVDRSWSSRIVLIDTRSIDAPASPVADGSSTGWVGRYRAQMLSISNAAGQLLKEPVAFPGASLFHNQMKNRWVPARHETPVYTAMMRLSEDSRFTYSYTPMGRLSSVTPRVPGNGPRVEFEYAPSGERAAKRVYVHENDAWVLARTHYFVYDRRRLLREIIQGEPPNPTHLVRDYIWGLDAAGYRNGTSLDAAGGAGGLLAVFETRAGRTRVFAVVTDKLGTVRQLVDMENGAVTAEYLLTPYGEPLGEWGADAGACPFRLHTRYYDEDCGLYYYLQRDYQPGPGKWITLSEVENLANPNGTSFCRNDPVNRISVEGE